MIYDQFWADRRARADLTAAMTQPLDVAVLAVQTTRPLRAAPHVDLVLRTNYLHRTRTDARLTQPMLDPACMDRGS